MSKKKCKCKLQERDLQEKLAKDAFNAHRKFTGCDKDPVSFDEMVATTITMYGCIYFMKKFVERVREETK